MSGSNGRLKVTLWDVLIPRKALVLWNLLTHRLFLYWHLRSVREPLLGNGPISDVCAPFLTTVFYFIHRLRGLSLCALQRCLCRLLFIHSWLNCGSEKASRTARLEAWTPRTSSGQSGESHTSEMYGASGIPELIPPGGPPRQPGPADQYNPGHPQVNGRGGGANPQRLGQRAPKLGQIGRSKKGGYLKTIHYSNHALLFFQNCKYGQVIKIVVAIETSELSISRSATLYFYILRVNFFSHFTL